MAKKIVFTTKDNDLEVYMSDNGALTFDIGNMEDIQSYSSVSLDKNDVSELIKSLTEFVQQMN